jgi:carboxylesterase
VSGDPVVIDAGPFAFASTQPDAAAVLCLHGLSGTPYEIRPLAEGLAAAGFAVAGPALPGHASSPEALAAITSWRAWLDAARDAAAQLRKRHRTVYVSGLSMGGLLSLALAAEGAVDAIAVIGTPLRLPLVVRAAVPWLWRIKPYLAKSGGSDIRDEAARARHPSYPVMPIRAVHELVRLQRHVDSILPQVRQPILVAHGALDTTARPADADEIARRVASTERTLHRYERSGHVVPVDLDGAALVADVVEFFRRRRAEGGAG